MNDELTPEELEAMKASERPTPRHTPQSMRAIDDRDELEFLAKGFDREQLRALLAAARRIARG